MGLDVTFYKATDPDTVWDPETRKHVKVPNFKGYEIISIKKPRLFMDWLARLHGLDELEDYATYPVTVTQAKELIERCGDIPVYTAPFDVLTQLTGFMLTRGMLCAMRRPPLPSVTEVCANARRVAVLENVMNPTNIGAIFRSAAALNMDAVLLTPACSDPLYRRAIRVSMGTVFQVPWTWLEGENYVEQLRQQGFQTAAMALKDDSLSIRDSRLMQADKLAIILGTEGDGLADCTIEGCDYTVKIPMTHGVDSLNVAAASAVAFWQLGGLE